MKSVSTIPPVIATGVRMTPALFSMLLGFTGGDLGANQKFEEAFPNGCDLQECLRWLPNAGLAAGADGVLAGLLLLGIRQRLNSEVNSRIVATRASVEGRVVVSRFFHAGGLIVHGNLEVREVLEICGPLQVRGSIGGGGVIRCSGYIDVLDDVTASEVHAEGNIHVGGSIKSRCGVRSVLGRVQTGGEIRAQIIRAESNIIAGRAIIAERVFSGGRIFAGINSPCVRRHKDQRITGLVMAGQVAFGHLQSSAQPTARKEVA